MSTRKFQLILHTGKPVAARFLTVNTEVYSVFQNVSILLNVKQGKLKLFDDYERIVYKAGDTILILEYSDYKAQRFLSQETNLFEALVFVLPDVNPGSYKNIDSAEHKKNQHPSILKNEILISSFKALSPFFGGIEEIDTEKVESLRIQVSKVLYSTKYKSIRNQLCGDKHRLVSFLHQHISKKNTVDELAIKYGSSTSTFQRLFVKELGVSPHQWIKDQRLHYARCEMQFQQKKASEMYLELGFEDLAHFSKEFKKKFGYNPSDTYENAQIEVLGS